MPSVLDVLTLVVTAAVAVSYVYLAYFAFAIRKALASALYRRHGLGVGFLALAFLASQLANFLPYEGILGLIGTLVFFTLALGLLYWVDTSILAARRSDPLDRDTLAWSRLRYVTWGLAIFFSLLFMGVFALITISPSVQANGLVNLYFSLPLYAVPIYTAAVSGVAVMPVAARRSRDPVFRSHLWWFFIFIATQLTLQGVVGQLAPPDYQPFVDGVALLVGAYPIYQSSKRLLPIYRFGVDES